MNKGDTIDDFRYVFASGFTRLEDIRDEQINKILYDKR